jgi:hypothetical protein
VIVVSEIDGHVVQGAYDAAVAGNIEALAALLGPGLEWRGLDRGWWLWRTAPS